MKEHRDKQIGGLQDTLCGNPAPDFMTSTLRFIYEPHDAIQIIHNGANHWLVMSTISAERPRASMRLRRREKARRVVFMYDSLYSPPRPDKVQVESLARQMFLPDTVHDGEVILEHKAVPKQPL